MIFYFNNIRCAPLVIKSPSGIGYVLSPNLEGGICWHFKCEVSENDELVPKVEHAGYGRITLPIGMRRPKLLWLKQLSKYSTMFGRTIIKA